MKPSFPTVLILLLFGLTVSGQKAPFNCPFDYDVYDVPGKTCSNSYIRCSNGNAYYQQCREGLIFHKDALACEDPAKVPGCPKNGQSSNQQEAKRSVKLRRRVVDFN